MRHDKLSITRLFEERSQYLIPLFQRGYVWNLTDQVAPLWEDIIDRVDALETFKANAEKVGGAGKLKALRKHFLGTVVIGAAHGGASDVIAAREVIDGQQRITTLQLFFLAMRNIVKPLADDALTDDLERYTFNRGSYRDKNNHLKVWPTNTGRDDMQAIARFHNLREVCERYPVKQQGGPRIERPLMVQAYLFFHALLECYLRGVRFDDSMGPEAGEDDKTVAHSVIRSITRDNQVQVPFVDRQPDTARAHLLMEALRDCFQIMALELEEEDDPQIIFETLNARGAPLAPSDLIRNFIFLKATRNGEAVDALYENYWRNFDDKQDAGVGHRGAKFWKLEERQGRLKNTRLDLLLYHYVALRRAEELKVAHVFDEFKGWWESKTRDTDDELRRVAYLAQQFEVFLAPNQTSRFGLFCRRMKLLDTATPTPLAFYFLEHHTPDSAEFVQVLDDLESYIVRRFVCGLTTKGYNRIFLTRLLAELVDEGLFGAEHLHAKLKSLQGDSQRWPDDEEFEQAWIYRSLYVGRNTSKVRALLEALELASRTTKQEYVSLPDDLTVEHIMPQRWESHWPMSEGGKDSLEKRNRLVHSIGNLTLVTKEFNSALSNEAFEVKRPEIVTKSLLMLNTYFQSFPKDDPWDEDAIIARAEALWPKARVIWKRS